MYACILMGGVYSFDGLVTSAGMYGLRSMLAELPGVAIETYLWANYQQAGAAIARLQPRTKVAVIGYSGGGSHATWLANMKARPRIDLLVAYDPSPQVSCLPIGANVLRAVCYHNNAPFFFGLGGGRIVGGQNQVETIEISEQHLMVQFDQALHQRTLKEVRKLL